MYIVAHATHQNPNPVELTAIHASICHDRLVNAGFVELKLLHISAITKPCVIVFAHICHCKALRDCMRLCFSLGTQWPVIDNLVEESTSLSQRGPRRAITSSPMGALRMMEKAVACRI